MGGKMFLHVLICQYENVLEEMIEEVFLLQGNFHYIYLYFSFLNQVNELPFQIIKYIQL